MSSRQVGAVLLVLLTACASTPRAVFADADPYEAELVAARYELHVLTADSGQAEPVRVSTEDFGRAMRVLAQGIRPSQQSMETAHWLMDGGLQADLLAEVEHGHVVRLMPRDENSPLDAATAAEMKRKYLSFCQQEYGGGDCLGLLADGPVLHRDDLRTLALALSLKNVLKETGRALRDMVSPRALVAMIVWTGAFYLLLWMLPEPTSKLLAAGLTLALLAWLPVHTLWSLMDGWARLVHEVDHSTSFEQLEAASEKFRKVMGENTARVLVMLVTAALSGSGPQFAKQLPKLPGFERAAAWAEAQGLSLTEAGEVESVAAADEGTFTLMVRRPGGRGATATAEAAETAEARESATTIIQHQGGNRQILFNGQRWHVPANRSITEIPKADPVGDQLESAVQQVVRRWSPQDLSFEEMNAIDKASNEGRYWLARLLERQARGRFVHRVLAEQFKHLRWSKTGVDAIDPVTGFRYELLSGTDSNMALHGRRLAAEFFRMITF